MSEYPLAKGFMFLCSSSEYKVIFLTVAFAAFVTAFDLGTWLMSCELTAKERRQTHLALGLWFTHVDVSFRSNLHKLVGIEVSILRRLCTRRTSFP
jgi:hypothetical protein